MMKTFGVADNGRQIELPPHTEFTLALPEIRTTGFHWAIEQSPPMLDLVEHSSDPPEALSPGAGGTVRWLFRASRTGHGELRFRLKAQTAREAVPSTFVLSIE